MYFLHVNALARDLKENKVTEHEKYKYYLAMVLLGFFCSSLPSMPPFIKLIELVASLIIFPIGIYWCYQTNKSGDNQHFIDRMVCLSLPITINLLIAAILLAIISSVLTILLLPADTRQLADKAFALFIQIISFIIYFIWKYQKIRYIAH